MSDFDDLAMMRERLEQCGRYPVEEAAAPAVADARPMAMARCDFPFPPINTPLDKCHQGPTAGRRLEELMERKLDDLIAALPEERRERVDARFEELKDGVREPRRAAPCCWGGSGRDCLDPQDQPALCIEDRETGRYVSIDT